MQPPMQTRMLIGTDFEAGAEEAEIVLNPASGETILELPEASAEQIDRAVAAAGKAFQSWRRTTPAERSNALLKLADRIEAEGAEFARLEALRSEERRGWKECGRKCRFRGSPST